MYKIYGTDQKEYGPINEETLRQWIADGRVNAESYVLPEGAAEWQTVGSLPEFSASFQQAAPPPGLKFSQEAQTARAYNAGAYSPQAMQQPVLTAKTSGMAITSLISGIVGFFSCGVGGIVGLIFGLLSLSKIKKSQGLLRGKGLAISGISVSAVSLVFYLCLIPFVADKFGSGVKSAKCTVNQALLFGAITNYANGHNNQLPARDKWCDAIQAEIKDPNIFKCPAAKSDERCNFGFNAKLSRMDLTKVNPQTVLFFETEGGWNVNGGPDKMITTPRHLLLVFYLADGTPKLITPEEAANLRWDP
jgi:hypothetical protein